MKNLEEIERRGREPSTAKGPAGADLSFYDGNEIGRMSPAIVETERGREDEMLPAGVGQLRSLVNCFYI